MGKITVKNIDKKFLISGSIEETRDAVIALLDFAQSQVVEIEKQRLEILQLTNENRLLKGEKKSPSSILTQFLNQKGPLL